ncbi:hypothetical protein TKK_0003474 [Trichogramma kaykai]
MNYDTCKSEPKSRPSVYAEQEKKESELCTLRIVPPASAQPPTEMGHARVAKKGVSMSSGVRVSLVTRISRRFVKGMTVAAHINWLHVDKKQNRERNRDRDKS